MAPFIATVDAKRIHRAHIGDILPENNHGLPVVPQLMGNRPADFVRMAHCLCDLGYTSVNWNLGCPFPMVAKKRRGSGLLPYPDQIDDFLDQVIPQIPIRLSIKTRLGRKHTDEFDPLVPIFNRYPLEEIIIHPRTGIQMYRGSPDLEKLGACLPLLQPPVVYNGDICNRGIFEEIRHRFPDVNRWMLGRGILTDPFLAESIRNGHEVVPNRISRFRAFHDDLFQGYQSFLCGPSHLVARMKGHWQYFAQTFSEGDKLFKQVKKVRNIDTYRRIVDAFWDRQERQKD